MALFKPANRYCFSDVNELVELVLIHTKLPLPSEEVQTYRDRLKSLSGSLHGSSNGAVHPRLVSEAYDPRASSHLTLSYSVCCLHAHRVKTEKDLQSIREEDCCHVTF